MAAPTITARTTPTGFELPEGYRVTIAFAAKPAVQLWEKSVKPFGIDGGDPIDFTTQHNTDVMTQRPPHLKKITEITFTAGYDPDAMTDLMAMVNNEDSITVHYPENSTHSFFGWLQKAEFSEMKVKEMPLGTFTVAVSNWDPVNKVEQKPVFTPAAGT